MTAVKSGSGLRCVIALALIATACSERAIVETPPNLDDARKALFAMGRDDAVDACYDYTFSFDEHVRIFQARLDEVPSASAGDWKLADVYARQRAGIARNYGPTLDAYKRDITSSCSKALPVIRATRERVIGFPPIRDAIDACYEAIEGALVVAKGDIDALPWEPHGRALGPCPDSIYAAARSVGIEIRTATPPSPSSKESSSSAPPIITITTAQPAAESIAISSSIPSTVTGSSSNLASADAKLNQTWAFIRPRFSDEEWRRLRGLQRQWIRDRDARCGTDQACLIDWTVARDSWLAGHRAEDDQPRTE